jgi:hypothetical protein
MSEPVSATHERQVTFGEILRTLRKMAEEHESHFNRCQSPELKRRQQCLDTAAEVVLRVTQNWRQVEPILSGRRRTWGR